MFGESSKHLMPELSIIVCTYNRDKYILQTLGHLSAQSASKDMYEVLIIDNNSTDQTASICSEFLKNSNGNFQYFLETNQGHTYARNRGIKEAKGDLLAFIDDDAFVRPDYVSNIPPYFSDSTVSAIGGRIIPVYEDAEEPDWMTKFLWPLVAALDKGNKSVAFTGSKFPIGANMVFRASIFEKYGLFDITLGRRGSGLEGGDEKEVFLRMKEENELILYAPDVVVDHIIPPKRTELSYIKGLAVGVGTSEKRRLAKASVTVKLSKVFSETKKLLGTMVLFVFYAIQFRFQAAVMLLRFRFWVISGFFK